MKKKVYESAELPYMQCFVCETAYQVMLQVGGLIGKDGQRMSIVLCKPCQECLSDALKGWREKIG